jgi:hypothetical protein
MSHRKSDTCLGFSFGAVILIFKFSRLAIRRLPYQNENKQKKANALYILLWGV